MTADREIGMDSAQLLQGQVWELPPVILHPFSDPSGPDKLVESSRAHLMMQGLLPSGDLSQEDLLARLLSGRLCELRMLYYVGKDLERWVEQCTEMAERDETLRQAGVNAGSFIDLLVECPPPGVKEKLSRWGVADYRAIFSRAIGLNAVFSAAPQLDIVTPDFIRNYYRYVDQMYESRLRRESVVRLPAANFRFELFASGEYSRMLEREWEEI